MNSSLIRISIALTIIIALSGCRFFSKLMDEKEVVEDKKESVVAEDFPKRSSLDTLKVRPLWISETYPEKPAGAKEKPVTAKRATAKESPDETTVKRSGFNGSSVYVEKRGTLRFYFSKEELSAITELKIEGEVDSRDLMFICPNMPNLLSLDLKDCKIENRTIPEYFFFGDKENNKLETLILPDDLEVIGRSAFSMCKKLKGELKIPQGVRVIGYGAFYICSGLTGNLVLPQNIKEIGSWAFFRCAGFTGQLILPEGLAQIGDHAFSNCPGFTGKLIIPNSITRIQDATFAYCKGFEEGLKLPDNLTIIEDHAFSNCSGLSGELVIPGSVKTIGLFAFNGCSSFTGILDIPAGVKTIGFKAFSQCSGLRNIKVNWNEPISYSSEMFPVKVGILVPGSQVSRYSATEGWKNHNIEGF
ncbi:MAG: hypothetical protein A2X18_01510 [Bacteroidetes bacterium GWF2_40_14]|nr:MAG: hypothetical protein A2X18_01510 [Bacteroidetes bacterium GWF2_40_14]